MSADAPEHSERQVRFSWWCRNCGWWTEVDLSGYCAACRYDEDRKKRGPLPEDSERVRHCRRCGR